MADILARNPKLDDIIRKAADRLGENHGLATDNHGMVIDNEGNSTRYVGSNGRHPSRTNTPNITSGWHRTLNETEKAGSCKTDADCVKNNNMDGCAGQIDKDGNDLWICWPWDDKAKTPANPREMEEDCGELGEDCGRRHEDEEMEEAMGASSAGGYVGPLSFETSKENVKETENILKSIVKEEISKKLNEHKRLIVESESACCPGGGGYQNMACCADDLHACCTDSPDILVQDACCDEFIKLFPMIQPPNNPGGPLPAWEDIRSSMSTEDINQWLAGGGVKGGGMSDEGEIEIDSFDGGIRGGIKKALREGKQRLLTEIETCVCSDTRGDTVFWPNSDNSCGPGDGQPMEAEKCCHYRLGDHTIHRDGGCVNNVAPPTGGPLEWEGEFDLEVDTGGVKGGGEVEDVVRGTRRISETKALKHRLTRKILNEKDYFSGKYKDEKVTKLPGEIKNTPGMKKTASVLKKSGKENSSHLKQVDKKIKDYLNFKDNSHPEFPHQNNSKTDYKSPMYRNNKEEEDFIDDFRGMGLQDANGVEDLDRIDDYLKGSSKTGNSQEYANAIPDKTGEKMLKTMKRKKKEIAKRKSKMTNLKGYTPDVQTITKESTTPNVYIVEEQKEIDKITHLFRYEEKTQ